MWSKKAKGAAPMKKRIFIIALCLCLLTAAVPMDATASGSVGFIAINDTLPPELINCFISYGGVIYVPGWLFASYGFGIYYSFLSDNNTAHLYNSTSQLFFELSSGATYDANGNYYSLPAIMRGGTVYVPLSYISSFFGSFSYSFISTKYGNVLRLTDGRVVLPDAEFVNAASSLMKQYYDSYNSASSPDTTTQTPGNYTPEHQGTDILLSFVGLPSGELLDTLDDYDVRACFFLTADEVRSAPDLVRRIAGEGHSLGALCRYDAITEYALCSALIFEAARVKTILITALDDYAQRCSEIAKSNSLVFCAAGLNAVHAPEDEVSPYTVTSVLDASSESHSLFLSAAAGMEEFSTIVLNYLNINGFDVFAPSETVN